MERWLLCPLCEKGQHTAGMALLNSPGDKNGFFSFVYCKSCKRQSKAGGWVCICLRKWHQCDMHSRDHLHGLKQKRRTPEEMREAKRIKAANLTSLPTPVVAPIPTRKRRVQDTDNVEPSPLANAVTESSGARKCLNLPPGLAAKFPHLAER